MAKTHGISSDRPNPQRLPEMATLLPLPKPIPIEEFMGIRGMFCYVIEHYGDSGLALLIQRSNDDVGMVVGDWDGNAISPGDTKHPMHAKVNACLNTVAIMSYQILRHIGVAQAILYFAIVEDRFVLVDTRLSLNKFVGPGMLQDVFGKVLETQKVICIESLNDAVMDSIMVGRDPFASSIILKPSRFRLVTAGTDPVPLYVEVLR